MEMIMMRFLSVFCLIIAFICSAKVVNAEEIAPIEKAALRAKYNIAQGKNVYERVCSNCHSSGVMDAPKFCDLTDWKPRMVHGMEHLVKHAVDGFNNMPAKGGMESLTVAESADAVAYMVDQCLVEPK
jgi:cytochrome c5